MSTTPYAPSFSGYAEVVHEEGIRYVTMREFACAALGDELVFKDAETLAKAEQAADRAVEDYRARREANRG